MSCLITTISALKRLREKTTTTTKKQKQITIRENPPNYTNLIFLTTQQTGSFHNETR